MQFSLLEVFDSTTKVKWPLVISCDINAIQLYSAKLILMDTDGNQLIVTKDLSDEEKNIIEEFRKELTVDPE